ncbi:unnamed protein product [Mycena citricolor]|uniref:Pentacotripeptide-repeat region of PRORP domain-containing protein n=1 Tax=Mycena citricolor TaxID=2018698 RepID=A0AAD2GUQ3_9AGAR|nr:unnamed protein product [Mycena citricolor]
MLPKVATQLLHSTSRAAVAAQNQSHHTLRNVLHSSSSSSPAGARAGPSSSGGSSNGPGPGGQKYTGSRFQSGYGGAGRAVTQANAMSSQDTSVAPTDEEEQDLVISHRVSLNTSSRKRPRSYSLSSSSSPSPNAPPAGILKTVQLHARSRHAFTAALSPDEQDAAVAPPAPALVRRNSTSSSPPSPRLVAAEEAAALPPLHSSATAPLPPLSATALDSADPAAPQTVEPPRPPPESAAVHAIRRAQMAGNVNGVAQAIREHLVDTSASLSVRDFNIAIEALREARQKDQSLTLLLQTYGSMLKKGVLPNLQTYVELILAIGDRDNEIHTAITTIRSRGPVSKSNAQKIERLQAENTFDSAMKLFETINTPEYLKSLRMHVFVALLRLCANHGRQDAAVHVLSALERTQLTPSAAVFRHMIRVYATPTSVDNAEIIFKDFLDRASSGKLLWKAPAIDIDQSRRQYLQVYNEMVSTYFVAGRPDKAVELLERMMSSTAAPEFAQVDTPHPAPSTYTAIISGFIRSGDLDTAITWFQRLLAQQTVAGKPFECSTACLT